MPPGVRGLARLNSVLYACAAAALLAAVLTVIYLQHTALAAQELQTRTLLNKMSEQTATTLAAEFRRILDGPVLEVLTAANPTDLQHERLDVVADAYRHGMEAFPQVERFFVWTSGTDSAVPGEVVFYGGPQADPGGTLLPELRRVGATAFYRDAEWGRRVYDFVQETNAQRRVYATGERMIGSTPYVFFVRRYWVDATRTRMYAFMGFLTNLETVRSTLFPHLQERYLAPVLNRGGQSPPLRMEILDESGRSVFTTGEPITAVAGRSTFDLRFYPTATVQTRLAGDTPMRRWAVLVAPDARDTRVVLRSTELSSYGLAALAVLLMLTGLFLAGQGFRRERELARKQADFVAHLSHQLKTPLSVLSSVCETFTLDRVRSPERQAQYLDMMTGSIVRLTGLVERVLEFSRLNDGRRTYERRPVDIGALVRETVAIFEQGVDDPELHVTTEIPQAAVVVDADSAALEQALLNLLDNAVKYSKPGAKNVVVTVARKATTAVIEVADSGVGISASEQPHLFEKFYRGAAAPLNRHGFGLGLAIVGELVRAHRGRVEVQSYLGQGSTFRIVLPIGTGHAWAAGVLTTRFSRLLPSWRLFS